MRKYPVIILLIFSGLLGLVLALWQERPKISVRESMESFHSPSTMVHQLEHDPKAGKKIFLAFCSVCHGRVRQIDIDAPRVGDRVAWAPFVRMDKKLLLDITINGAGAMPARGGCFECSDKQLQQAIDYILNNSKPSKN